MKSIVVGTAGHIDHGKTALVKALTGIDADRLEEEKRRGITIDIGFAHLQLFGPSGEAVRIAFIDVPGHERFVRNMLAGIGGIDLVLLVIAADASIKPQTREHFDICRLLSVRSGITVLTKSDSVDAETLDVVRLEVEDFLRGSFLESAPIIPVSSLNGSGIEELKSALLKAATDVPARDSTALTRLPIDRVFSVKGFGTVVTGTLVSGAIRKEDELEVFPQRSLARVRGVQVHDQPVEQASAGERTALNLAGTGKEALSRGSVLAVPETFAATTRIDVSLSLLPSAKSLKDRARVHFHAYTFETVVEVVMHGGKRMASGETGLAQLRLADATLLQPGDRFIIRQLSPVVTIGGGVVLDAAPLSRRSKSQNIVPFLEIMREGSRAEVLSARIARRGKQGLSLWDSVSETGWGQPQLSRAVEELAGKAVSVGDRLVEREAFESLTSNAVALVSAFQKSNPLLSGISREVLREQMKSHPDIFAAVIHHLTSENKLEVAGEQIRLPGTAVVMKDEEAESKKTIEQAFAFAGLKVPALKDVLADLKVDRTRAQKIVTLLLRDKVLVKTSDDLVFHREALDQLREKLKAEKTKSPRLDVARFKDITGVSRKYAIPLLEYFDREHVTRRVGDDRLIL
ncbi:MAG TPA: selenocysteine-specific translation elongation factor [Terriglobales bacterium]|nr:selenocysteine-specific translation elongation factor [Terriglobales bacterium]